MGVHRNDRRAMQVESRLPSAPYHTYPSKTRVNGTHSDFRPNYSPSPSAHSRVHDMHPYQQHYGAGPPGSQQQRQYQQANQLPPMYPAPGQPGPSNVYQAAAYQSMPQQPQQAQNIPPQTQQQLQPKFLARSNGKHTFELRVEQQPQRARMCGFGDKDRRPITPPPCIKLVITDLNGNLVPTSSIDGSFFVLQVDLWDDEASREVNIVRSSSTTPAVSISTATTTSYPPVTERQVAVPQQIVGYTIDGRAIYQQVGHGYPTSGVMQYDNAYYQQPFPGHAGPTQYPLPPTGQQPTSTSMYTRNLIGSLTVNASVLKDPDGNEAYWFVLQDLSVRTEGWFRLRMQFFNVANPHGEGVTKGASPCLALVYSDKFQVYSAKKFPGVIESTTLSKCFAQQGIKIPIRKDMKMEEVPDDE